jgi:hypothetical protein
LRGAEKDGVERERGLGHRFRDVVSVAVSGVIVGGGGVEEDGRALETGIGYEREVFKADGLHGVVEGDVVILPPASTFGYFEGAGNGASRFDEGLRGRVIDGAGAEKPAARCVVAGRVDDAFLEFGAVGVGNVGVLDDERAANHAGKRGLDGFFFEKPDALRIVFVGNQARLDEVGGEAFPVGADGDGVVEGEEDAGGAEGIAFFVENVLDFLYPLSDFLHQSRL